jgi:hypothetical protein
MIQSRYFVTYGLVLALTAGFAVNCGKKGPTIEQRIQALEEKGAPDSILSNAKVYFSYLKNPVAANQGKYKDSLKMAINGAEAWYAKAMTESKTYIESVRKTIVDRKAQLTGLHLKDCDELLQTADSLVKINWLIAAREKFEKLDAAMPSFLANQKKADELRPTIIGTWKAVNTIHPTEDDPGAKWKAVETRIYTFAKDGSFNGSEEKHGQTAQYWKEDWKFLSWGKYDFIGDSIYLFIKREKCAQQIYTQFNLKTNQWVKKVEPNYDSTYTNNKKDKYITYADLKSDFKKSK